MKSWSDWLDLNERNVNDVPDRGKGVYAIRRTKSVPPSDSDIIYIGNAGTGNQGVGTRLANLLKGLREDDDEKAKEYHYASPRIRRYISDGLQFSWTECFQQPDGIEKAFLLAFWTSAGRLPIWNERF